MDPKWIQNKIKTIFIIFMSVLLKSNEDLNLQSLIAIKISLADR